MTSMTVVAGGGHKHPVEMFNGAIGPRSVWMCTTRKCNFACGYCYQGSHAKIGAGLSVMMSHEIARKAVAWSHVWGRGPLQVIWYGGEPTIAWKSLMKDLVPQWIEERQQHNLPRAQHSVTSNGSLLRDEVRKWMDEVSMGLLLSLDGPERFHDLSRPYYNGKGTWSTIPTKELLQWRPNLEIAWQLDPKFFDPATGQPQITPDTLDEMMGMGFRNINFNIQWMVEWSETARWNLFWFFKHVTLKMIERERAVQGGADPKTAPGLGCNWWGKLQRALTVDEKMDQPCGTGMNMVGVSPEGWLYPSQEMCYTVFEPGRAPGTPEYYRLGDLSKTPVMDMAALARLSKIKTSEMRTPAPFNCETCVAKSASIGGCHCRYVGDYAGGGMDVSNRFDVTPGYCQSTIAVHLGMLAGAAVAHYIRPDGWKGERYDGNMQAGPGMKPSTPAPSDPQALARIEQRVIAIANHLSKVELVRLETVE